jgi:AraC-like DNA-binding protein
MTAPPADMAETPALTRRGPDVDALSDVLRVANLTGGVFLNAEFFAPWCVATKVSPDHCTPALGTAPHLIPYHYVAEGRVQLRLDGDDGGPLTLDAGQVVVLPRNDLHFMGSDLSLSPVPGRDIIRLPAPGELWSMRHGGDGERAHIVCGFLGCDGPDVNPVLGSLPAVVKLTLEEGAAAEWIRSTLRFAAEEIAAGRPGSEAVLEKVSELLFVETVRRHAERLPEGETGWLAGLRDPYVARALAVMHRDVARDWSVDELGREAGLSRSALADRFVRLIGVPPGHYLARWRMQVAMQKLRTTGASIAEVAAAVGYESEAAFSRAFKKVVGRAPGGWRRAG